MVNTRRLVLEFKTSFNQLLLELELELGLFFLDLVHVILVVVIYHVWGEVDEPVFNSVDYLHAVLVEGLWVEVWEHG